MSRKDIFKRKTQPGLEILDTINESMKVITIEDTPHIEIKKDFIDGLWQRFGDEATVISPFSIELDQILFWYERDLYLKQPFNFPADKLDPGKNTDVAFDIYKRIQK